MPQTTPPNALLHDTAQPELSYAHSPTSNARLSLPVADILPAAPSTALTPHLQEEGPRLTQVARFR